MKRFFITLALLVVCLAAVAFWAAHDRRELLMQKLINSIPPQLFTPSKNFTYHDLVAVLMFHDISKTARSSSTITPALFDADLSMLASEGYHVIPAEQFARFLAGKSTVPDKAVVITFDDGYEAFYKYAYPQLLAHKMPATEFVIVGTIGPHGAPVAGWPEGNQIPKLSWAQLKEMQAHGMSFYSHSYNTHYAAVIVPGGKKAPALAYPVWLPREHRRETPAEYRTRVRYDLREAKEVLQDKLGRPVDQLAWPFGWTSPETVKLAQSLGYRYLYTIQEGMNGPRTNPAHIYRIEAGGPDISPRLLNAKIRKYAVIYNLKKHLKREI
ncbi:polysaccharide deacetylase family protein [Desulfotomaculum copahuensis]|uniref:NodB homology domain-containing protein n=1 Tax=Desulfotomaculum copahuensis TaxID=1838280 RepID=A0A1B7LHG2_9FIRM|nr:polysaccharide deacetylase family protein [Desulfotomaculum copahuensis]OAT85723.1 hypothetical protein A6M21_17195 [Desulfotomaculum copahuensis]